MQEMQLVLVDKLNPVEVFTGPEGIEKILSDIEKQVTAFVPDTSTAKGRKDIASLAYKVSQSKVVLDDLGKGLVSEWKTKSALVDASRKIARDRLDALRDKAREPLTLWEAEEEKRIAAEKLAKEIEEAHTLALAENILFDRARELAAKEAEIARIEAERVAKEAAEKAESERIANEERIRREAEEKAKLEAEEAAAAQIREAERKAEEAKAAAEKAERDRIAAEKKAKADQLAAVAAAEERARQEAARVESERLSREKAEREKAEAEKREAERKAADVEHRRNVNKNAVADLIANADIDEEQAKQIIIAIASGLVRNVSVNY